MSRRIDSAEERAHQQLKRRSRIRLDLENKGMAPESSAPVAERLAAIASGLTPEEYAAVLDGVATAYKVKRPEPAPAASTSADMAEIQRLMEGFADELQKLDEGLRILSAYVTRMRSRSSRDEPPIVH
jgi:hypothetical protein